MSKMLTKQLIFVLIIASLTIDTLKLQDLEDDYGDNDMTESITSGRVSTLSAPRPTSSTPTSTSTQKSTQICVDLKPEFVSTRKTNYKTLDCSVRMCDTENPDDYSDVTNGRRFAQPIFDWNSQFGHIYATNGTCDDQRIHCWHSINIDLEYLSHQMMDNGLNEMRISCSVSDYLNGNIEDSVQWTVGSDYTVVRNFKGRAVDQSCDNDSQCGDNMFCLSGRNGDSCQCSVDFSSGVPYVEVMDTKYEEWICMPPLMLNDTCLYDQQCQATDTNSICGGKHTDSIDKGYGTCQCADDTVFDGSNCEPQVITEKSTIIWWIFSNGDKEEEPSMHRFWYLKTASYLVALLSILLPISLILIVLGMFCYKRMSKKRSDIQTVMRPKFPSAAAPKIIISDLLNKQKSEDKYDLVKNDHLISH